MKKIYAVAAVSLLCACATGNLKMNYTVDEKIWTQDPMNMCASLIEQNKKDLAQIEKTYGKTTAQEAAALYQELDLQSNAVCRSRIAGQMQVERLKELRSEYQEKINLLLTK
ncbi:MAG: hypothetical protein IKL48_03910 [Elusimicrobiaceae bacterium]|nr:hypothetical protein [Elusimicrobiaceae bacterium]